LICVLWLNLLLSWNFWPLSSLSFIDLCLLIKPLVSSNFWPFSSLSFIDLCLLITPLSLKIPKG
jgi:hypothetical protein